LTISYFISFYPETIWESSADWFLKIVGQDSVGCPPHVTVAKKNGQVVAVKLHAGFDKVE
jgi:hypothetical protein